MSFLLYPSETEPHSVAAKTHSSEPDEGGLIGAKEFEAAEHEAIGNSIEIITDRNRAPIKSSKLPLKIVKGSNGSEIPLFFGRIIALAGDYYTSYDSLPYLESPLTPISGGPDTPLPSKPYDEFKVDGRAFNDQSARFTSAVKSLSNDSDGYLFYVGTLFDNEEKGIEETLTDNSRDENTAQAYHRHDHGIPTDAEFAWATTKTFKCVFAKYAKIAWTNFDHFNVDAVTAYGVGHTLALDKAIAAGTIKDALDRKEALKDAYFFEAFAAHYLTDVFSSGHDRTPRRKLHDSRSLDAVLNKDSPVNDNQCRYMHDNDSAAGLLVSNGLGHNWIAYGDKQFFSPQNVLNRYYSVQALQTGVQEVTNAFEKGTKPAPADYRALKLAPSPQLAYSSVLDEIPAYDSIAPLWIWNDSNGHFTTRSSLNDHSDFSERQVSDPTQSSGRTNEIKHASFAGEDQFPNTWPLAPLTGGFIHIQELPQGRFSNPSGRVYSANTWGTIDVPDLAKAGKSKLTFTLRNRTRQFDTALSSSSVLPLFWTKSAYSSKTSLIRFDFNQDTSTIQCSSWPLIVEQPDPKSQVVKVENLEHLPLKVSGADFRDHPLRTGIPGLPSTNLQRFFVAPVLPASSAENPSILSIGWVKASNEYRAGIMISSTSGGCSKPINQVSFNDAVGRQASNIEGQFKLYKGQNDSIPRVLHTGAGLRTNPVTREWAINNDSTITANEPTGGSTSKSNIAQVLVGDISGKRYSQLVAISGSWPSYDISLFESISSNQPWVQVSTSLDSATDPKYTIQNPDRPLHAATLNTHYFTALIPRYGDAGADGKEPVPKPGLDILQVSSLQTSSGSFLNFRTWILDPAKSVYRSYRDGSAAQDCEIKDEFYGNPNYFSIEWLRASCEVPKQNGLVTRNAVMQVFSFYGVLGVRMWAPMKYNQAAGKSDGFYKGFGAYVYKLVGQCPYMGTPSLGMGLGAGGNWGYGVLPWGDFGDWADFNRWDAVGKVWVMRVENGERKNVRGWNVRARLT